MRPGEAPSFTVGDRTVDLERREVRGPDGATPLTALEAAVLACLREAMGRIVPRDELARRAWGTSGADGRAIDNLVRRLRVKIEDDPARPRFLATVRGQGYRWTEDAAPADEAAPAPAPPPGRRLRLPAAIVDLDRAVVVRGEEEVALTPIERKLLAFLVERPGALVGKDELMRSVWGWKPGLETRTVEKAVQRLRHKIEADPSAPVVLRTDRGGGFRWVPPGDEAPCTVPPEVDATVGRATELARLEEWLAAPGLLTIKGPSGVGKTRLAQVAARAFHGARRATAWWIELPAGDVADLAGAVARGLGITLQHDPEAQIGAALSSHGDALVVLDNVEAVAVAPTLDRWRAAAPRVRFVVTSLEPLHARGERVLELGPLPLEDGVALLVDRARARGAEVASDPALPEIVRRLDGLPLALELAASRMGAMTPAEIAERIEGRLDLLAGGPAEALRAAFTWSFGACTEAERAALAQLTVFRGGFTLAAAEGVLVLPGGVPVADAVAGLVDRSLVTRGPDGRYAVLQSTRTLARDQLADPVDAERRHGAWFARYGDEEVGEDFARRRAQGRWRAAVREIDNLEAACRRAVAREDAPAAAALASAVASVLSLQGPHGAVLQLLEGVLRTLPLAPADEVRVRRAAASAAVSAGRLEEANGHAARGVALARSLGLRRVEGGLLATAANARRQQGRLDDAERDAAVAHAIAEEEGDLWLVTRATSVLGTVAWARRDLAGARRWFEIALAAAEATDDRVGRGVLVANLGTIDWMEGDLARGDQRYAVSLALHQETGNRHAELDVWRNRAVLAHKAERWEDARGGYERALALARQIGLRLPEAMLLVDLAALLRHVGRHDEAARWLSDGVAIAAAIGAGLAPLLAALERGRQEIHAGRADLARAALQGALALARRGTEPWLLGSVLCDLAWAEILAGAPERAAPLLAEAEPLLASSDRATRADRLLVDAARRAASGDPDARTAFRVAAAEFDAAPLPTVDQRARRAAVQALVAAAVPRPEG